MHNSITFDPTQGQGQCHEHLEVKALRNGHFQKLSPTPFITVAGK